jgi:hypothetical protein
MPLSEVAELTLFPLSRVGFLTTSLVEGRRICERPNHFRVDVAAVR